MNVLIFEARRISSATRFVVLAAAALALAACETDGTGPTAAGAPRAEVASAKPAAPESPKAETPKVESPKLESSKLESSRSDSPRSEPKTQAAKPEPVADPEPMTHSRAARECWMKTEKANAHTDLDKRADLVNKCIDERLKAAGVPAPKT